MEKPLLFDQTIKRIEFIFQHAGLDITSGDRTTSNHQRSRIIYSFNSFWLNLELAGAYWWFIDGVRKGSDFLELTYDAPCLAICSMAVLKGIFLTANEKHVHKLIDTLRRFEIHERKRTQTLEKEEIVKKERKFLHAVLTAINVLYVVVVVNFAICPLVIVVVKYHRTGELDPKFPFLIWYPINEREIKVWPFVYLHQVWAESVVSLNICAADYFFFTCCSYIRIQFRLLQHDLENIIPSDVPSNSRNLEDDEYKNIFKDLMKWHQDLIESTEFREKIYTKSILLNFLSSSLIICLTGFNVTTVNDTAFVVAFVSFLFMSLVQVFFLCCFADLLMSSSMEIGDAVYNSQWYMAEPKIRKKLLLVMIRCQKPCKLTAFGFADVSLNSFMRVLSTSWSYFALLQTMYRD